ncbi:lactonase family protein [Dyadobacter sp. CY351]|uniref:lactonase family protein n=1 Tax=Dyadobacter sp. CY351 TaxID=2909337 RepID=UPI001F235AA3|nr:lactonase family protein [Dyadobacter sp. CY351]MCF2518417.1 lactonase family protein [Dyadobacter sp. CY351]
MAASLQNSTKEILYVGTYTPKGEGVYVYQFDRYNFTCKEIQLVPSESSPSFLEFDPGKNYLYATNEGNNTISSFAIDRKNGLLTELNVKSSLGDGPCHVSLNPTGQFLYISNYNSGDLSVYKVSSDGSIGDAIQVIPHGDPAKKSHMHSVVHSLDGKYAYASDLGTDKIMIYTVNHLTGRLTPASDSYTEVLSGDGPRHLVVANTGHVYSVGELSSVINTFEIVGSTGTLIHNERVKMLPGEFIGKNSAADIHISPDGNFLYASNRGHDSLAIYQVDTKSGRLSSTGFTSTGGSHPRNFLIDETGAFIVVANRDTDNLVFFERKMEDGQLLPLEKQIQIPSPVCVKQLLLV